MMKLIPALLIVCTLINTADTVRWVMRMAMGEVFGISADIAFVLNALSAVLMIYVMMKIFGIKSNDQWGLIEIVSLERNLLLVSVIVSMFASIFEKVAVI